jgi:energy-coupling factor transporter transmembrane protein EcfT
MNKRKKNDIPVLVSDSPLRKADPRAKLVLSIASSLAVMMPLERLVVFMLLYVVFLFWSRLMTQAVQQIWRLKYLLLMLFIMDTLFVDVHLAVIVTLRVILLAGVFALFVSTTTSDELRLALERLGVPYRFAFSLSMAFQSVELLQQEWHAIHEAQMARGLGPLKSTGLRTIITQLDDLIALTVPAIVLTTRRAWAITEAACARGFDAPHRKPYREITMRVGDWLMMSGMLVLVGALAFLWI